MKVGEYVRTKTGEIGKLVNVEVYYVLGQNDKDKFSCVLFNNSYVPCIVSNDFIIKKGQLIDLIQVGDYVNGHKVVEVDLDDIDDYGNDFRYIKTEHDFTLNHWVKENEIETILTREQFSSMEYKVN